MDLLWQSERRPTQTKLLLTWSQRPHRSLGDGSANNRSPAPTSLIIFFHLPGPPSQPTPRKKWPGNLKSKLLVPKSEILSKAPAYWLQAQQFTRNTSLYGNPGLKKKGTTHYPSLPHKNNNKNLIPKSFELRFYSLSSRRQHCSCSTQRQSTAPSICRSSMLNISLASKCNVGQEGLVLLIYGFFDLWKMHSHF